jgi:hypothetical protein
MPTARLRCCCAAPEACRTAAPEAHRPAPLKLSTTFCTASAMAKRKRLRTAKPWSTLGEEAAAVRSGWRTMRDAVFATNASSAPPVHRNSACRAKVDWGPGTL